MCENQHTFPTHPQRQRSSIQSSVLGVCAFVAHEIRFFGCLSPSGIHLPHRGGRIALGAYQKSRVVTLIEQVGRYADLRQLCVTCEHMSKMQFLNITLANWFTDSHVSGA